MPNAGEGGAVFHAKVLFAPLKSNIFDGRFRAGLGILRSVNRTLQSITMLGAMICLFWTVYNPDLANAQSAPTGVISSNFLMVSSVSVHGKMLYPSYDGYVNLGGLPDNISFHFEPATNLGRMPIRLRWMLEGYDKTWHEGGGMMFVGFRYYDHSNIPIAQPFLPVSGQSSGWNGSLIRSTLTHRHEILTAPPNAASLSVIISSAGPPATEGVYVIANLVVSKKSQGSTKAPEVIITSPLDHQTNADNLLQPIRGWMRDGNHLNMAKIVKVGSDASIGAFAIFDNDPISHAEWRMQAESRPSIAPGDSIIADWDEMYSIGVGDTRQAVYPNLPAGAYTFKVEELDLFGMPTGVGTVLNVRVPQPFWKTRWFWSFIALLVIICVFGTGRYLTWRRFNAEMLQLKHQQELERERLRISHDIHDDLGARVTQISLVSALAEGNQQFSEEARTEFGKVTLMARDLVSALYQTVWAVNPENDNLEALGNYLCQMVSRMCEQTQFRCRFYVSDLPKNIQVSSQIRHNITMAVKEAVHNIIKHADASKVEIGIDFKDNVLSLSVSDNGKGFDVFNADHGCGLTNMAHRLSSIGGKCELTSKIDKGTTLYLTLAIKSVQLSDNTLKV